MDLSRSLPQGSPKALELHTQQCVAWQCWVCSGTFHPSCSQGVVVYSHLAQVKQFQGLPRPGLTGRSGRKGLGTRYPDSLDGKAQEQVTLGCCSLEDVQGARSMPPHFSSERRPLLCKDIGGFWRATCCPEYIGQSLVD